MRSGEIEYVTERTFFIFGRVYKVIDGRPVPIDVSGSAGYTSPEELREAMAEAVVRNLLRSITHIETMFGADLVSQPPQPLELYLEALEEF